MARGKSAKGPKFLRYFGPLLDALRELGGSATGNEVVEKVAESLKLTDAELNETTSNGARRFPNQVAWGRFYLTKAGFLDSSKRGIWSLTAKGWETHLDPGSTLAVFADVSRVFREKRKGREDEADEAEEAAADSAGAVSTNYRELLLDLIRNLPPEGFERLCQRLLRESGFIQVVVTGRSGDEGIDGFGTLQINPFVSFKVLFQCKRYKNSVSPSHVRDFRGAMQGRADKGIIITTGTFTAEAQREAARDGAPPIELVDSESLVSMFERLEIGLRPVQTYELDTGFFEEFQKRSG